MLVGIWFLISKMSTAMGVLNTGLQANERILTTMQGVLSKIDTICSGGAGYVAG